MIFGYPFSDVFSLLTIGVRTRTNQKLSLRPSCNAVQHYSFAVSYSHRCDL